MLEIKKINNLNNKRMDKLEMVSYIGTKELLATPMTLGAYNKYRGWELPADEDGNDEGMLVEYVDGGKPNHSNHKGYISWSPINVFNNAYNETKGMTFGQAIEALKLGKAIARKGWNANRDLHKVMPMFIFKQIPAEIGHDIIPKMQSVPDSVKGKFIEYTKTIKYTNQIAVVNQDGNTEGVVDGWVPSISAVLAEDWYVVK